MRELILLLLLFLSFRSYGQNDIEKINYDYWQNTVSSSVDYEGLKSVSNNEFKTIITGKMVMDWMGISKGNANVGKVINSTYKWANNNSITNKNEIIKFAKSIAKNFI